MNTRQRYIVIDKLELDIINNNNEDECNEMREIITELKQLNENKLKEMLGGKNE